MSRYILDMPCNGLGCRVGGLMLMMMVVAAVVLGVGVDVQGRGQEFVVFKGIYRIIYIYIHLQLKNINFINTHTYIYNI